MDEQKIREILADVVAIKNAVEVPTSAYEQLCRLERKLGAMLPPIKGHLHIDLDGVKK